MRSILLLLFITATPLLLAAQKKAPMELLDNNNGLYYQRNHMKPFTGIAESRYPNGDLQGQARFKDGKLHGKSEEWSRTGRKVAERHFKEGVQVKTEQQWYPSGKLKLVVNFEEGKPEGMITEYHENGKKKSEGMLQGGAESGVHTWWFENGNKDQEVPYTAGKADGTIKQWYQDGQLKSEIEYKGGVRNGSSKEYHQNGKLRATGSYRDDKEQGEAMVYDKRGILIEKRIYDAGEQTRLYNYRPAAIRLSDGFVQVFNERDDFFTLRITGQWVRSRPSRTVTYAVDGKLLQIYLTPVSELYEGRPQPLGASERDILTKYIDRELALIADNTDYTEGGSNLKREVKTTANGKAYIHWSFDNATPKGIARDYNLEREHYYSFVVGGEIVSLYTIATKRYGTDRVLPMLDRTMQSLKVYDERIDLNSFSKEVE